MIARPTQLLNVIAGVALLLANVVAFNMLIGKVRGARVDLTEGKVYTLSKETRELLQEPEEPLEIFFYHTALDRLHEKLRPLVNPLADILREFAAASDGHVTTRIVEWDTADKATQDRATEQFGVRPRPIPMQTSDESTVRNTYFSLVVAYGDQHQRFDQSDLYRVVQVGAGLDIRVELQNVEYIVAKAIYKVVRGFQSIGAALATHDLNARIELYFSPKESLPKPLEKVPEQAAKIAKKIADEAMGRVKVETVTVPDPKPDAQGRQSDPIRTRLEREYGITPLRTDIFSEPKTYSWAVIKVSGQFIPVPLAPRGEEMTEFEVKDLIEGPLRNLIPGFLMTVGVMSPDAARNPMAQMMGQREPPEEFKDSIAALEGEFEIRRVDLSEGKPVPRQVSVLLLIRPETLSDKAIYEIDQFLMRGGRLVVCADSYAFDLPRAMQTGDANTIKKVEWDAFRKFLRHAGADVGDSMILDTKSETIAMARRGSRRGEIEFFDVKLPYFVYCEAPEGLDQGHDIIGKLQSILVQWATPVRAAKEEAAKDGKEAKPGLPPGVVAREIAWTSPKSSTSTDMAQAQAQGSGSFEYKPPADAARQPVALVLTGSFPSYFAGKPIPGEEKKATESAASRPAEERDSTRLDKSKETSIVVIGDSDFMSSILTQALDLNVATLRQNLAFIRNAIDFGGPEAKLMAIRNRENVQRPLLALREVPAEERQQKTSFARWLALIIPCFVLAVVGIAWAALRGNRKPLPLPGVTP
jgi:ABC-2 type transport system permease protein